MTDLITVDAKNPQYTAIETALYDTIMLSSDFYTSSTLTINYNLLNFAPVFSLSRSYGRNLYNTHKNVSAIFTQQAVLSEILSLREYLQYELYKTKKQTSIIPTTLTNKPSNFLFEDLVFLFNYYNLIKTLNDRSYIELYDLSILIDNLYNSFTDIDKRKYMCNINEYVKYKMYLNLEPIYHAHPKLTTSTTKLLWFDPILPTHADIIYDC